MRLTGDLKDKAFNADSMEEKKSLIAQAGMELTDDEVEIVTGGFDGYTKVEAKKKMEETMSPPKLTLPKLTPPTPPTPPTPLTPLTLPKPLENTNEIKNDHKMVPPHPYDDPFDS